MGTKDSRSDRSGDTIVPNESMYTGDKEYEPTTTDSEESLVSAKGAKKRNKKQTTLTQTFGEKTNNKVRTTKLSNTKLPPIRRQTRLTEHVVVDYGKHLEELCGALETR